MRRCVIEGCHRGHRARGFCGTHYEEWYRKGKHSDLVLPKTVSHECSVEGCKGICEAKDFCSHHYRKMRRDLGLETPQSKDYLKRWCRSLSGRWIALKRAARDKGLGFDITQKDHRGLISLPCCYCGGLLAETGHALDRKDSSVGYLLENVVPCCADCNRIKNDILTYEEMLVAMTAIKEYRQTKKPTHYG